MGRYLQKKWFIISIMISLLLTHIAYAFPTSQDTNNNGMIDRSELGSSISLWIANQLSRNVLGETIQAWVTGEVHQSTYTFEYPASMKNGYYTVPMDYCPLDKCTFCQGPGTCGKLITIPTYHINEGYEEDFTYEADIPIVSIWDLADMSLNEIQGKCYVGDCNRANKRHVVCVYDADTITSETFTCDKWKNSEASHSPGITDYCAGGKHYTVGNSRPFTEVGSCTEPITVNFYHVYNDITGPLNWETTKFKITNTLNSANNYFNQFGINLEPRFYEYKVPDNSAAVCDLDRNLWAATWPNHPANQEGDIQIEVVSNVGTECGVCNSVTYTAACITTHNFIHELGHQFGCPHPGEDGSLGPTIYSRGAMAYGQDLVDSNQYYNEFVWECKIVTWLLGQNG